MVFWDLPPCLLHFAVEVALGLILQLPCVAWLQISARCMLSIFQFFATKTDASVLRMLNGSPEERLLKPIAEYITSKGGRIHTRLGCKEVMYEDGGDGQTKVTGLRLARAGKEQIVNADAYIAALDVPGELTASLQHPNYLLHLLAFFCSFCLCCTAFRCFTYAVVGACTPGDNQDAPASVSSCCTSPAFLPC